MQPRCLGTKNMVGTERKNNILDEKTAEGGTCSSFGRSSESNRLKDSTRTALALNDSPRRCIVFQVFTLEFDACQKLLLPVALPMHESNKEIHMGPGVCGNLDNLKQASATPSIRFKFDRQKEQMIHMSDCRSSAKAFMVSGFSRENAARQSRKKNKRCKSVKNLSTICLQSSVLPNVSSCLICDGSNLVIHSALANGNLTVSKPMKRNLKKTKKKGNQFKSLLHWRGSVGSGNVSEESVCESSITNNPSSPEEISMDVPSEEPTSNSLPGKDFQLERNDNDGQRTRAIKPYAVSPKYLSSTDEMDAYEQIAALSDEIAREDSDRKQTIHECFASIGNYSSAEQTSEGAISTRSIYIGNLGDKSLHSSPNRNNALILDTVVDNGSTDNTACSGVDVESDLFIDKGSLCGYAECVTAHKSQQEMAPKCITSNSCKTNHKKPHNFETCDSCSPEDPATYNIDDRTRCSSQACSSSTSNAFSPVKGGRKVSAKFNALHKFGNTNTYARTRKDVNHSVWQRVQKNSGEESIYDLKDPNSFSLQHDIVSQVTESRLEYDASFWIRQSGNGEPVAGDSVSMKTVKSAADTAKHSSKSSGKLGSKMPEKLKMKSILVPKQDPRKGSQNSKNDLNHLVKKKKNYAVSSSSLPDSDSQRSDVSPIENASGFPSKPWASEKTDVNEMSTMVYASDIIHNVDSYAARDDIHLLAKTLDSLDMKCTPEVNCDVNGAKFDEDMRHSFYPMTDKKSAGRKSESGSLHAEHSKQDGNSLPILLKWVPVGKRDESRSMLKNISSENVDCFFPDLDGVTDKPQCSPCHKPKGYIPSDFHFSQEAEDGDTANFEADLRKINLVVKEAYKLQIASETFQLANGSQLAEFERLLYSASPVLGQMFGIWSCKACSQGQLVGDTLCRHQVPNISLQNIWQWYEKPGNYGLEVKVEDYLNPTRLGNHKYDFRAYFVPYLSAVQLFGRSARCTCRDSCISDGKINKEHQHEVDNMSKDSSQLSNLPMFSLLVPCPRKEVVIPVPDSSPSSVLSNDSDCKKCSMAQGLLFEYFESDQPQLRRPLFEKIKELVSGSSSSNSQIFGDPSKLECLNLHDLHPASWFSVAWYPIYRIPDGSFRAAFLTYHSLGHFTQRNASVKSTDGVSSIVSPVVGLQSYNAKGECWFRQKESPTVATQTGGSPTPMPSEILKERLRTLEATASVMSRASVPKGDQTSLNRQPDYEFFLSRWS